MAICSHIQEAVLAPLPWDLTKCVSLARVLQQMAYLLKQQPLQNSSVQQIVERDVGTNLFQALGCIRPAGIADAADAGWSSVHTAGRASLL
ncbi:TPA: hypothetical protein ACH3X3_007467 [Trebouxia sp. C0006]